MSLRAEYRKLIRERAAHVMPGVYDALSARIAERAGFKLIGGGGFAAIGAMLGGADMGQSNMRDYADHYGRICAAVNVPVSVDADTGFGDVHNVTQMVRSFETAGVSGIMISDQSFPNRCGYLPGKDIITVEEMIAKIRAAVAARRDPDLVIIARTDSRADFGLDEAIMRCKLFLEAGADISKPQGVDRPEEIARCLQEIPCEFAATLSQAAKQRFTDIAELKAQGVATISMPSIALFAAAHAVDTTLRSLATAGSLSSVETGLMRLDDYNELVNLNGMMASEIEFREEASRLVQRHNGRSTTHSSETIDMGGNVR
ncbi:oxaloacetate decarboxylase [Agrobacterium rubi]|uniref:isocitrate lyase/PEP mutase family protein n=1 Tax=Agrobacterium rubi TaxID=28099 RepID=UPI0015748054|nr:oxaloacetate decarboxylase [Agrobacterium rubi]NTF08959.1 oxaloacetate decarboxylase [Agrobacterium rubi]NTF21230.1 oxaloacetate decarboxylase [Agrobacterium rubi]NTF28087.1 oxaloacetate decarboxylase [Agrobacterium rubi]